MTDLERAREEFSRDRFATECCGAVIEEVRPGYARCTLQLQPEHCNAMGRPMGGAVFTLADFAFAVASNFDQTPVVSLPTQITFLGAAKGKTLTAEARQVKRGRSTCFFEVSVTDELGTLAANAAVTGYVMQK